MIIAKTMLRRLEDRLGEMMRRGRIVVLLCLCMGARGGVLCSMNLHSDDPRSLARTIGFESFPRDSACLVTV